MLVKRFVNLRPYCYHATSNKNIASIKKDGRLKSAAELIRLAGQSYLLCTRRPSNITLNNGDIDLVLQNQYPLHEGNVALQDDWTFADLIRGLNERIFFWPGTKVGPIPHGMRHIQKNAWDGCPAVIKVATEELLALNDSPSFCRFNSGAPRWSGGRASPRGNQTFVSADKFRETAGEVVELVFKESAKLPPSATYRWGSDQWQALFI